MVGGGEVEMEVPVVALAARMKLWAVGGRQSHPFVSFSAPLWEATTGRSTSAVCNWVTMLVITTMRPMWSCGSGLCGVGRLASVQRWNQTRALVRAMREWIRDDSWIFDGNGLGEGQDVVTIVCNGGQRLGSGLIHLNWLFRLHVLGLDGDDAIFVIVFVCLAGGFLFLCPLRDGAGENLQDLARVQLPVEDRGLREKWREEDGFAQSPVPLLLRSR